MEVSKSKMNNEKRKIQYAKILLGILVFLYFAYQVEEIKALLQ